MQDQDPERGQRRREVMEMMEKVRMVDFPFTNLMRHTSKSIGISVFVAKQRMSMYICVCAWVCMGVHGCGWVGGAKYGEVLEM